MWFGVVWCGVGLGGDADEYATWVLKTLVEASKDDGVAFNLLRLLKMVR